MEHPTIRTLILLLAFGVSVPSCGFLPKKGTLNTHANDPVVLVPQVYVSYLPNELAETSGLIQFRGRFWSMNDSGGKAILYGFSRKTGNIEQQITLTNAENRDWEALTQDNRFIYIGDVGNNSGARNDLRVYTIRKMEIPVTGDAEISPGVIHFTYADQADPSAGGRNRSFDCEAMVADRDSLWLFTKDWNRHITKCYIMPAIPGQYVAQPVDSFPADGLITDACLLTHPPVLVLSGYKDFSPFLWIFSGFKGNDYFGGYHQRINMPYIFGVQTEGVSLMNHDSVFISAERTDQPQRLYLLKLNE